VCKHCGHLQTDEIADAAAYYDDDYTILVNSEEEDQIYEVRDGQPYYRTEHQVTTLLDKLNPAPGMQLLDYGCAKSSTMRALMHERPDLKPCLFDVSNRYVMFWEGFLAPGSWATYELPGEWTGKFDIVTSFFSLEHMTQPGQSMRQIVDLLAPDGMAYGIVPNVFSNTADFLVIDHVNHFTRTSLGYLLASVGLQVHEIDDTAHRGAFVFIAEKSATAVQAVTPDDAVIVADLEKIAEIADFWSSAAGRLQEFESGLDTRVGDAAVYGAGFYGAFIRGSLKNPDRICCILDQNPFLHGSDSSGVPVVTPAELPAEVRTLLVGLNPAHARNIISEIPALAARELDYFYL
jgi:SAM-dependent methyltransferase